MIWPFRKATLSPETERQEPTMAPAAKPKANRRPIIRTRTVESGITTRLTADWSTTPVHIDQIIFNYQTSLVARSRDRFLNDDYGSRFVNLVKTNVVGPQGFQLQSQVVKKTEKNPSADIDSRNAIETAFKDYKKKTYCDVYGRMPFVDINNNMVTSLVVDGEILLRYHKTGYYGLQIEVLDAQRLDVTKNHTDPTTKNEIRFGIEYNSRGRVAAYHLSLSKATDYSYFCSYYNKNYERIDAEEIEHLFIPLLPEQKRGLPWMTTSLLRMKMLGGYENAALVNARAGASKMGFYELEAGDEGPLGEKLADGSVLSDFEAGHIQELPEGVSFKAYDPSYPSGEFETFVKACLKGIASGLGVDYISLANDLEGVSYSSIRQGELLNRELWKASQQWIIDNWLTDFYETRWLPAQYDKGTIRIQGQPISKELSYYLPQRWQGRRWNWVDPLKDMQSKEKEYELRVTSLSQIIRDQGRDPDEVWLEIEEENKRMKELNIEPGKLPDSGVSAGENNAE